MKSKVCFCLSACFIAAFVVAASVVGQDRDWRRQYEFFEKFEADLAGVEELSIQTNDESIEIKPWDENRIAIEMTEKVRAENESFARELAEEIKIVGEKAGSRFRIKVDRGRFRHGSNWNNRWSYSGLLEVRIPARLSLDLDSDDGSISVDGIDGEIEVRTDDGSVSVDTRGDAVDLRTDDVSVRVGRVAGRIYVRTDDGGIELEEVNGNVDAATDDGSIDAYLADSLQGDIDLRCEDGHLTVELGSEKNLHIIAEYSDGGRIRLDIPVRIVPGEYRSGHFEWQIGNGEHKIRLRTDDGSIRIKD